MKGDLRVWWIPQVPMCVSFAVEVSNPQEAKKILNVLADYDIFQFDNNIKPDYCNAGGLSIEDDDGVWIDWQNDDGETIDEVEFNISTDKTCATCQIFKLKDDPDVTCMDECFEQTGCSMWTKQYTKEEIERYSKRR